MTFGFIMAMEAEYEPFLLRMGNLLSSEVLAGVEFCTYNYEGKSIVLAKCGIGVVAAASATALLIGHFHCEYIYNYGLVGSLDGASLGSLAAVKDVVHYDADVTAFGHPLGAAADQESPFLSADSKMLSVLSKKGLPALRLASGDKFIADDSLKNELRANFSANICDMEGAGIALACKRASIPFTMIKLVSDGAGDGAVSDYKVSKYAAFDFAIDFVLATIKNA